MNDLKRSPVPHDHAAFIARARARPGFSRAYEELEFEYQVISELLSARTRAGLTQQAVAEKMGTTTSTVSRLESAGRHSPSISTLRRYAKAVGCKVQVRLVPAK